MGDVSGFLLAAGGVLTTSRFRSLTHFDPQVFPALSIAYLFLNYSLPIYPRNSRIRNGNGRCPVRQFIQIKCFSNNSLQKLPFSLHLTSYPVAELIVLCLLNKWCYQNDYIILILAFFVIPACSESLFIFLFKDKTNPEGFPASLHRGLAFLV
jgi:hypothetical protein